jgi:hypothetical protein
LDRLISRLPHDRLLAVADALERVLGLHESDLPEGTRLMTWDEVRALHAAGIDVGGHTVNHVALANVSTERARAEIARCHADLSERLGASPRHFAYPNGYYTPEIRALVARAGFELAVTTEDSENRRGSDPFALKRKVLWENSSMGPVAYSEWVAACNLDGVFGALGFTEAVPGERPDGGELRSP